MRNFEKKTDFYIRTWNPLNPKDGYKVKFLHIPREYEGGDYDWYMIVALEKADKVAIDRHLLTSELLLQYRWAIREGYSHQLDSKLKNRWDYPANRNTIEGIKGYIEKIKKLSEVE